MGIPRRLSFAGAVLLLALLAPPGAGARPPQAARSHATLPSSFAPRPSFVGAHLVVSELDSAPSSARTGHAYALHGTVVNEGSAAARGRVVVRLLRVGSRPLPVGGAPVTLAAHASARHGVRVRVPRA